MKQYHDLLKHILATGTRHEDRTGVGTISAFGYQTRFDLREGFPIVTTKRVPFRWVAEELFWFLSGSTDEADLRARGVDIWQEWATPEQTARLDLPSGWTATPDEPTTVGTLAPGASRTLRWMVTVPADVAGVSYAVSPLVDYTQGGRASTTDRSFPPPCATG